MYLKWLCLIIVIVFFVIIYKYLFPKLNKISKVLTIILTVTSIIYLMLLPLKGNLENYKNTNIDNNKGISSIISLLEIKKESFSTKDSELTINLKKEIPSYEIYKILENKSSIMFNLINNLEKIIFNYEDNSYSYNLEDINLIYNDIKNINIKEINNRYKEYPFTTDGIYMGNVGGLYDVFDESVTCDETSILFYEENDLKYYITCSSLDDIYLYSNEGKSKLIDLIFNIKIEDLLKTNLNISVY